MMHHFPNDDKENADPRGQHGKGFPRSRSLSPGKRKRTPEEKLARPPLRDITGVPGITPTFVLEPPAFAIAADVDAAAANTTTAHQHPSQQHRQESVTGSKKKAPAAKASSGSKSSSSGGDSKPGKKPGAGGAGAGGSMLSGQPLRPLR